MNYRDKIKSLRELNDAYDSVRSATRGLELITKLSKTLVQMPHIPELPSGITSVLDAMPQQFNHITALERSMQQETNLVELTRPLTEITTSLDNNIINLINVESPILAKLQNSVPSMIQGMVGVLNDAYFSDTLKEIGTFLSSIDNMNFKKIFEKTSSIGNVLETIAQNMTSGVEWLNQINFSNIVNSFEQTKVLETTIWKYEQSAGVESVTSNEEIAELHNDFQDLTTENKNWQQTLAEKIEKWTEKNPIIYTVIMQILIPILLSIFASFIYGNVSAPKAAIKEEPSATGDVIYNISINQEVTIIDDTRYYYKVIYHNKEIDKTFTGWISKRSIEINNNNSIIE